MALGIEAKKTIQYGVDSQTDFSLDNVSGRMVRRDDKIVLGRLPKRKAAGIEQAVYVVYSYGTPIAWALDENTWYIPRIVYSDTTTHHQGVVRVAVDNPGFYQ